MGLCPKLAFFLWLLSQAQCCSELLTNTCICLDERAKGTSYPEVRRKVVCSKQELQDVPPSSLLPNRTGHLILSNNKIAILKTGAFSGLQALEKLLSGSKSLRIGPNHAFQISQGNQKQSDLVTLSRSQELALRKVQEGLRGTQQDIGCQGDWILLAGSHSRLDPAGCVIQETGSCWLVPPGDRIVLAGSPSRLDRAGWVLQETGSCCLGPTGDWILLAGSHSRLDPADGPLELPILQLIPSLRQVVFQGDRLPFLCTATYLDNSTRVLWYHNNILVQPQEGGAVVIVDSLIHDCSLISSELILSHVYLLASGEWECVITTSRGNASRKVDIVVIDTSATYCQAERVTNNRGDFRWPRTLAGITVSQPCLQYPYPSSSDNGASLEKRTFRKCQRSGQWAEADYSECLYTNDYTRVLYTFILMPINSSNALTLARQLLAYTVEAANFRDMMDVIYVAQMIEKFISFTAQIHDLGDLVVEMASNMMLVDERILWLAQQKSAACSRIVQSVEHIAVLTLASDSQAITKVTLHRQNSIALASVQLPPSLLSRSAPGMAGNSSSCRLQFVVFRNGKLFPSTGNSSSLADNSGQRIPSTPVIFTGTDGCGVNESREPILVSLRHWQSGEDQVAACWNFELLDGYGGWQTAGCQITQTKANITNMWCHTLSNMAVLKKISNHPALAPGAIQVLHPIIYSCTVVLLVCLFIAIISYILKHNTIRVSRKNWHMLLNLWFHISMTCAVFTGGINQTEYGLICQVIGIVLHYSSLSTLLWIGVAMRVIYKEVTQKPQRQQEPELSSPSQQTMLRFYLIAGGIPLIICGITAAVNLHNYSDYSQ
ncbi:adhesion G protein-coupled receptor A2-like [Rhincodon typus]|uniref:adhesion G protein-coupled receptor A2-like n=1 Tax=Rhincodon typus TaxID=259920 RepID=UPI00202FADF0|nr:adhesion G protein-coupled receptor A2-like [Rhincodon typus]